MDPYISESLLNLLVKDSHLTDVNSREMSIPVGSWGGNAGKLVSNEKKRKLFKEREKKNQYAELFHGYAICKHVW